VFGERLIGIKHVKASGESPACGVVSAVRASQAMAIVIRTTPNGNLSPAD